MKIRLNIDELVLQGFDRDTTTDIGNRIQNELTMLIVTNGLPNALHLQNHKLDSVDGGSITIQSNQKNTQVLCSRIAKSIYNSIDIK